jgi:hypothetical protein
MSTKKQKYLIRSHQAGVFYGEIECDVNDAYIIKLKNARQIWYWEGAATILELSKYGTSKPNACKFTVVVDSITICNVVEIIPCTKQAMDSIDSVPEWREE